MLEHLTYLAFFYLLGASGIIEKLKSHEKNGITPELNEQRKLVFGSNWKDPIVAESCCSMFKGALDDFMLKLLTVCAIVSITVDMSMAEPHERSHGKSSINLPPCLQGLFK
jgi:hypothetical protein